MGERQPWLAPRRGTVMELPAPDPAFSWSSEPWGHALRCARLDPVAQHLFTSKQLGLPDAGAWTAALESVSATADRLMRVKQVHGNAVRILRRDQIPADAARQQPDGDSIISNEPGQALAVMVADCVPILLVDRRGGAAGAIHAGWRGTCARIASTAVDSMHREFGTNPADLAAAIGPSAGPDDYEVGESLVEAFREAGHRPEAIDRWFIRTQARPHLNLWAANRDQLIAAGVASDRIWTSGLSTVSNPAVFSSYRVDGERAGRMAAVIVVPVPA